MSELHVRMLSGSSPAVGTQLSALLDQFLTHMRDFRDCAQRTVESYNKDADSFINFLRSEGVTTAEQVQRAHVHRYAAELGHLAPATIRRRIYSLRSWFSYLADVGVLQTNPVASVQLPKRRPRLPRVPTEEQCAALLMACETPQEEVMVSLLLMAGLRKSELLGLSVDDVGATCQQLRVLGKGRRERVVPLCGFAKGALQRYLAQRDADGRALILNKCGGRIGSTTFYRIFRRILRRAGLQNSGLTPHSLRHGFGTYLIRNGVDVATVCELMGHSNISVTSAYLHADVTTKSDAVARLPWAEHGAIRDKTEEAKP